MSPKTNNERNRIRLTWLVAVGVTVLIALSSSIWEKHAVVEESLFMVACLLAGVGAMGRAWCSVFISGRKDGELVRLGPYAMCRNPLYFFSMIGALGVGLATETFTIPLILLFFFVLYYPGVITAEEKRLKDLFGESFETYRREVPCFFPKWSRLAGAEPNDYPVSTRTVRHCLFDALWFVWIVGLIELVSAFHEAGWLPTPLILY